MFRYTLLFLMLISATINSVQAEAQPKVEPVSLSATDLFSTSFAACEMTSSETRTFEGPDVLATENIAPCCTCLDVTGGLICQCNNFPCACTPVATGQCRCVCGGEETTKAILCLLLPESIYCQAPPELPLDIDSALD